MRAAVASAVLALSLLAGAESALAQWGVPPTPAPPSVTPGGGGRGGPSGAPAPLIGFGLPIAGLAAAAAWFIRRRARQQ